MTHQQSRQYGAQQTNPAPGTQSGVTGGSGRGAMGYGEQPPGGSQSAPVQGQGQARGSGLTLEEAIGDERRIVLHDLAESARVCEWCADQCIDEGPGMAQCVRRCRDVADVAGLTAALLARNSTAAPELADVFTRVAEECARECARHADEHCKECAAVLTRSVESTRTMLAVGGGQGSVSRGKAGSGDVGHQFQSQRVETGGHQPQGTGFGSQPGDGF